MCVATAVHVINHQKTLFCLTATGALAAIGIQHPFPLFVSLASVADLA
jgi:hypothetical protein